MGVKIINCYLFLINLVLINSLPHNEFLNNEGGGAEDLQKVINKTNGDIEKLRIQEMIPGIVAGISIKGKDVWIEAFGQTDIENNVKTKTNSVWRLASISKTLTTALVAKLVEKGLIDLEKPIHDYLSADIFPIKQWNGKNVNILVKHVMSHTAGLHVTNETEDLYGIHFYQNVTQSIRDFKDKPLIHEPGNRGFNYSNFGFQIMGAIIEKVMNQTYETAINQMFRELLMTSTYAERHDAIIPNRAHYYIRSDSDFNRNHKAGDKLEILNTDIMDDLLAINAQWPSGGIVSTVPDLLKFGNYMLNSYKGIVDTKKGYLKSSLVKTLWTPVTEQQITHQIFNVTHYCLGWRVTEVPIKCSGECRSAPIKTVVYHAGGLAGVTTLLAIFPEPEFVVVVLNNLGGVSNYIDEALTIAKNFL